MYDEFAQLLAVERDDRDALEISPVQGLIRGYVALVYDEVQLGLQAAQRSERVLAQVAAGRGVHRQDGHRARSGVAGTIVRRNGMWTGIHSGRSPFAYASSAR